MEKSESKQSLSNEFQNVPINDQRLINRLIVTAEILENQPEKSIPDACGNWAATKATYQLFANEKVTSEAILNSHRLNTIERIGKYPVALLIQDTSAIDFSTHKKTEGLGPFTSGKYSYGLLMHSVLAVSPNGVPLGLLNQDIWTREALPKYTKRNQHRELPIEAKESHKWLKALDDSLNGLPNPMSTVTIADREADIYEFFKKAHDLGTHLLIRAARNRRILEECKLLFEQIEQAPEAGQCVVDIPRRSDQNLPPRQAKLTVRHCRVTVYPAHCHIKEPKETIALYAVLAREIEFPEGEEPVEWFLLTTIPVGSLEEAIQKIEWYRERWKIERFHYILKSGCNIEDLQLETKERLENAIALYSVIAWRLSWLTYQARATPDFSCSIILEKHEWQALYCVVNKTHTPPEDPPTLSEAVLLLARLGGFLGRKHDGKPGVKVLWRGLQKLNEGLLFVEYFRSIQPSSQDMGNV
jgi:hypothetical protein